MKNRKLGIALTALALSIGVVACAKADDDRSDKKPVEVAVQDRTAAPKMEADKVAAPAETAAAPGIMAYAGKDPFDPVQGVSFFQNRAVRDAIVASGAPRDVQQFVVFDGNVVVPIRSTMGRLMASGYDPAGAGVTNWAILMTPAGKAAVCYSSGENPNAITADWYYEGDIAFTLEDRCPSRPEDIESFSNWPIGPIPG